MSFTTDPSRPPGLHHRPARPRRLPRPPPRRRRSPCYGTEILLHAASADDGGSAQVDRFARQLGVPVENRPGLRRPLPGRPVLRPGQLPDGRHFRGGHGPPPRARLLPRLRHPRPRYLDLTLKRQAQKDPRSCPSPSWITSNPSSATRTSTPAEDFQSCGVDMLGGCQGCHATIACYNAYPSTSGYWRCADCIGDTGFATVADFTAAYDAAIMTCPACGNTDDHQRDPRHHRRARRRVRARMRRLRRGLAVMTTAFAARMARRHLRHPPPQGRRP